MPSILFDPFSLRTVTLKNRIGVSPMCQYSSENGKLNDWHLAHLGARAVGGAGLVMIEATAVEARGRISPHDAGLWEDSQIDPIARIERFVSAQNATLGIQLAHAGRKASVARPWDGGHSLSRAEGAWKTVAPSAVAFGDKITHVPEELSISEIEAVQNAFAAATERALAAGLRWVELHFAHGYLVHTFLSPLSNFRTDRYGGSFENRIRFALEVTDKVRKVWPEKFPLTVRLSATDWDPKGWTIEDSVELCKKLKEIGVDLIDCSSGFVIPGTRHYPFGPGWQTRLSEKIRKEVLIPTAAVGEITGFHQAETIVQEGKADLVLLAREMLRQPHWAWQAAKALGDSRHQVTVQYLRS